MRLDTINYVGLFRGRRGKLCVMVFSEKNPVIVYCEFVLDGVIKLILPTSSNCCLLCYCYIYFGCNVAMIWEYRCLCFCLVICILMLCLNIWLFNKQCPIFLTSDSIIWTRNTNFNALFELYSNHWQWLGDAWHPMIFEKKIRDLVEKRTGKNSTNQL